MQQEQIDAREAVDKHLSIIRLLSSGTTHRRIMRTLVLSPRAFHKRISAATNFLSRHMGLSDEEIDAVLSPRVHGHPSRTDHFSRYSGPGLSIERVQALTAFDQIVDRVSGAQSELQALGLDDLSRWAWGWRPANYGVSSAIKSAVDLMNDADDCLYIWPNGLRLGDMIGELDAIDVKVRLDECEKTMLLAWPMSDLRDPMSSIVYHKGCGIAVPLCDATRTRWEAFLKDRVGRSNNVRVRLLHVPGIPPSISFCSYMRSST